MNYQFVLEKLNADGQIRYWYDGARIHRTLVWDNNNEAEDLPWNLYHRLRKDFKLESVTYAIEGNEETGFYRIKPRAIIE